MHRLFLIAILFSAVATARATSPISIEVDLTAQKARVLMDGQVMYEAPISSGRPGFGTHTGQFQVVEKDADHHSSLYGVIVDKDGHTLVANADSDMPVPRGARFVEAPMKHFLRFDGATGLHAGWLPGYPASHGCVRLPPQKAELFFNIAEVGTPVRVFGVPPQTGPRERKKTTAAKSTPAPPAPTPAPKRKWLWFAQAGN